VLRLNHREHDNRTHLHQTDNQQRPYRTGYQAHAELMDAAGLDATYLGCLDDVPARCDWP